MLLFQTAGSDGKLHQALFRGWQSTYPFPTHDWRIAFCLWRIRTQHLAEEQILWSQTGPTSVVGWPGSGVLLAVITSSYRCCSTSALLVRGNRALSRTRRGQDLNTWMVCWMFSGPGTDSLKGNLTLPSSWWTQGDTQLSPTAIGSAPALLPLLYPDTFKFLWLSSWKQWEAALSSLPCCCSGQPMCLPICSLTGEIPGPDSIGWTQEQCSKWAVGSPLGWGWPSPSSSTVPQVRWAGSHSHKMPRTHLETPMHARLQDWVSTCFIFLHSNWGGKVLLVLLSRILKVQSLQQVHTTKHSLIPKFFGPPSTEGWGLCPFSLSLALGLLGQGNTAEMMLCPLGVGCRKLVVSVLIIILRGSPQRGPHGDESRPWPSALAQLPAYSLITRDLDTSEAAPQPLVRQPGWCG